MMKNVETPKNECIAIAKKSMPNNAFKRSSTRDKSPISLTDSFFLLPIFISKMLEISLNFNSTAQCKATAQSHYVSFDHISFALAFNLPEQRMRAAVLSQSIDFVVNSDYILQLSESNVLHKGYTTREMFSVEVSLTLSRPNGTLTD